MASRFDTWQATGPINLPIETYAASASANEKKTEAALKSISDTYGAYQSITPFGADAKALYDQTMGKLKSTVDDITKSNLNTPDAKRKIQNALGNRDIINPLKSIMQHTMDATKRKAEVDEYLKKNPEVNAVNYLEAFNKVGKQKGDANNFNPNEFKDLGVLGEYVDIRKRIEESASKILESSTETQRILGSTYDYHKRGGRLREAVLNMVKSQMKNDSIVQGQLSKNLKYQYYQANPYDLADGGLKVAAGNRSHLANIYSDDLSKVEQATAIMNKEKNPIRKGQMKTEIDAKIKQMADFQKRYQENPEDANGDKLNYGIMLDGQLLGYDYLSNLNTSDKQTYNPMAMAAYNNNRADSRQARALAARRAELAPGPGMSPLTFYDKRDQAQTEDGKLSTTISAIPGFEALGKLIDKNGVLSKDNLSTASLLTLNRKGATNTPAIIMDNGKTKIPAGYVKAGKEYDITTGKTVDVYKKQGSLYGTASSLKTSGGTIYDDGLAKIKKYLNDRGQGVSQFNGLKTPEDVKAALKQIAVFESTGKSAYAPMYELAASSSEDARMSLATSLSYSGVKTADGKDVTSEATIAALQNYLASTKQTINYQPFTFFGATSENGKTNLSYYSFRGPDGTVYKTPMPKEYQSDLSGLRKIGRELFTAKGKPITSGSDLIIYQMGNSGEAEGKAIIGGNTAVYQKLAKDNYETNIKTLMQHGLTRAKAEETMNDNFSKATDHVARTGQAFPVRVGNQTVLIGIPVRKQGNDFYTLSNILQTANPSMDISNYYHQSMRQFGGSNNLNMDMHLKDDLKSKPIFDMLGNDGTSNEGLYVPKYESIEE